MVVTILQHTPPWVWAILTMLVGLGPQQSVARTVSPRRRFVLPLAMAPALTRDPATGVAWG